MNTIGGKSRIIINPGTQRTSFRGWVCVLLECCAWWTQRALPSCSEARRQLTCFSNKGDSALREVPPTEPTLPSRDEARGPLTRLTYLSHRSLRLLPHQTRAASQWSRDLVCLNVAILSGRLRLVDLGLGVALRPSITRHKSWKTAASSSEGKNCRRCKIMVRCWRGFAVSSKLSTCTHREDVQICALVKALPELGRRCASARTSI